MRNYIDFRKRIDTCKDDKNSAAGYIPCTINKIRGGVGGGLVEKIDQKMEIIYYKFILKRTFTQKPLNRKQAGE